ncbi:hypothetical protein NQK81_11730 [Amycolatopsis roodepoortensis]|uniref:hypothetical protein n=1 Tax=Amycolatopsis roodepoortensis TaxID=700274 RepID=UPI00214BCC31|nr:hypothetical protein [Amycolatopsis roodepoortensis]UUV34085.1 hypothetical protein NQK81_11730 [Amycolatopsis roodepoortensis]
MLTEFTEPAGLVHHGLEGEVIDQRRLDLQQATRFTHTHVRGHGFFVERPSQLGRVLMKRRVGVLWRPLVFFPYPVHDGVQ